MNEALIHNIYGHLAILDPFLWLAFTVAVALIGPPLFYAVSCYYIVRALVADDMVFRKALY